MSDILEATLAPLFLDALADYHELMEAQLKKAHHAELAALVLEGKDTDDERHLEVHTLFTNFKYKTRFSFILRYSIIISAYGITERALYDVCHFAKDRLKLSLLPSDLTAESDIARCKKYLDTFGIDVVGLSHWEFISNLAKVRNALVHANGFMHEPEHSKHIKNLRSVMHRLVGVIMQEDSGCFEVHIESVFCTSTIARLRKAIDDVYEAICNSIYRQR